MSFFSAASKISCNRLSICSFATLCSRTSVVGEDTHPAIRKAPTTANAWNCTAFLSIPRVNIANRHSRIGSESVRLHWNVALDTEQVPGHAKQLRPNSDTINNGLRFGETKLAGVVESGDAIPVNAPSPHHIKINLHPTNDPLN